MCDYVLDGFSCENYYILKNCNGEVLKMNKNNNINDIIKAIYSDYNFKYINLYYYNKYDLYVEKIIKFEELEKIKGLKIIQAKPDEENESLLIIQVEENESF